MYKLTPHKNLPLPKREDDQPPFGICHSESRWRCGTSNRKRRADIDDEDDDDDFGYYDNESDWNDCDLYCPSLMHSDQQDEEDDHKKTQEKSSGDWERCLKRRMGASSSQVCDVWRKEYVDINLTAMNLEKLFCNSGAVMLRTRNAAPLTMDCISSLMAFVSWLVRLLRSHACIERLDLAVSELIVVGISRNGNLQRWENELGQCDVANEQIATAVFSTHRLTHLRMRRFEFCTTRRRTLRACGRTCPCSITLRSPEAPSVVAAVSPTHN